MPTNNSGYTFNADKLADLGRYYLCNDDGYQTLDYFPDPDSDEGIFITHVDAGTNLIDVLVEALADMHLRQGILTEDEARTKAEQELGKHR